MKVIGPTLLFEMTKGDKRVILCGDQHEYFKKQGCIKKPYINLQQFLKRLFLLDPNKQWDFYLEHGGNRNDIFHLSKKTHFSNKLLTRLHYFIMNNISPFGDKDSLPFYAQSNQLFLTWLYFARFGCFTKKNCSIKNTRFHVADIRQKNFGRDCHFMWLETLVDTLSYVIQSDITSKKKIDTFSKIIIPKMILIFKNLLKCFNEFKIKKQIKLSQYEKQLMKIFTPRILILRKFLKIIISALKNKKTIKQCVNSLKYNINKNIPPKEIALTVLNLIFSSHSKEIIKKLKKIEKNIEKQMITLNKFSSNLQGNIDILINSFLMDMYVMGRVTRKWDGKEQKNVVILAGSAHIIHYMQIFQKLGYKIRWKARFTSLRCATIPDWVLNPKKKVIKRKSP